MTNNETILFFLSFLGGFLVRGLFTRMIMLGKYIEYMQDLEKKFLLLTINFIEWKSHSLAIMDLAYEYRNEEEPEKIEEYKAIKNKMEEKYDRIGEQYVKGISEILPYRTKYKNFKDAINYIERHKK